MIRLLHPRLHRTLPELDGLAGGGAAARDAVRWSLRSRAAGRLLSRAGRFILTVTVGLLAFVGSCAGLVVWIARQHSWDWQHGVWEAWVAFLDEFDPAQHWKSVLVSLLPAVVLIVAVWRLLNRAAVRRVLARRGLCDWCGYTVAGQTLSSEGSVVCPECSRVSGACSAIGERLEGVFAPNRSLRPVRFWTWRRMGWCAGVAATVGLVWGGVVGVRTWMRYRDVKTDAELARADLVTLSEYRALLPAPAHAEGAPNVFALVQTITKELRSVQDEVQGMEGNGPDHVFDATLLLKDEYTETPENARDRVFTRTIVDKWIADGGSARLAELIGPLDYTYTPPVDADGVFADLVMPELSALRNTARLCRVMAWRGWVTGDTVAWSCAARGHIACVRAAGQNRTMIGRLVAVATDKWLLNDIRARVFDLRDRATGDADALRWLDAFEAVVVELARATEPLSRTLDGERLFIRHSLAKSFADAERILDGSLEKEARQGTFFTGPQEGRLGRYVENRDAMKAQFDRFAAQAVLAPPARTLHRDIVPTGLLMVDTFKPSGEMFLSSIDQVEQLRIAVAAMIALERFRLATGSYPEATGGLRMDPVLGSARDLCGSMLVYRRAAREDGRGWYELYSIGLDGEDNGGAVTENLADAFSRGLGKKKDAVYSDPGSK